MNRRDILRKCGAVGTAGGLGLLAGCSGGGESDGRSGAEESASLEVTDFDYHEDDSGELVVTVTIENSGESEGTGHLYVTVTAAATTSESEGDAEGETTTENAETVASRESREVTVPAGETTTLEIPFEFTVEQFHRRGDLKVDLRT
ncbi:hypothetical protein BRD15_03960 [Halobacteriales archaeon SW_6_65_15]|jgi:hypothetical protein|nr:MAG: hypothetical protein BRD15_03960 [Halobacteriales archaeon SW_6_65_15]